jgi:hypothetical protein
LRDFANREEIFAPIGAVQKGSARMEFATAKQELEEKVAQKLLLPQAVIVQQINI